MGMTLINFMMSVVQSKYTYRVRFDFLLKIYREKIHQSRHQMHNLDF